MIPIPAEVQTLLKSKCMIGPNTPTGVLSVSGQPTIESQQQIYGLDENGKIIQHDLQSGTSIAPKEVSNFVTDSSGNEYCVVGGADGYLHKGTMDNNENYLIMDGAVVELNSLGAIIPAPLGELNNSFPYLLKKLPDNSVLLFVYQPGDSPETPNVKCYRSPSGDGNDFAFYSTVIDANIGHSADQGFNGVPLLTTNNELFICITCNLYVGYGMWSVGNKIFKSVDYGATWTTSLHFINIWALNPFSQLTELPDGTICTYVWQQSSNNAWWNYSTDRGVTWQTINAGDWNTYNFRPTGFYVNSIGVGYAVGNLDLDYGASVKTRTGINTIEDVVDTEAWTDVGNFPDIGRRAVVYPNYQNRILIELETGGVTYMAGFIPNAVNVRIKSLTVDRSKGAASQLTAVLDNKDGLYSPDNINSEWFQVFWPNKVLTTTMGYGLAQQQVFTGLTDTIEMDNYAADGPTLEVIGRDFSKKALDQMAQMLVTEPYPHVAYVLLYEWQTPEYIFRDLALKAGWADQNIHTEVTGIVLPKFVPTHEQYGDSFQKLAELSGFEWLTDEIGDIYFRVAVDPAPVAQYVYREGEDIFKLGYKFTDGELYRDVVVWSMSSTDPEDDPIAVRATVTWSAADYNNVLPHKTMIVQAADIITTVEGCTEIANRIANSLTPKPRLVNFAIVGNPYLQIGDCIQVIESSSTISELYRITELTHSVSAEGDGIVFSTTLRCYHYAYVPI